MKKNYNYMTLLAAVGTMAHPLMAQTKPPVPETKADEPITLDTFTVTGVDDKDQIMPTARPISSVMGDARNILDTPRSVSSVNKEMMNQVRIKSVTDLSQFAPGVYTAARYGLATTPMVRGDLAELYFNGQRAKYSRDSVMPSFNGVEALDIVKGPGSAVYGPQSNGAAGYTNFVTKKPFFDKQHTEISLTYGALNPDRNYSNVEWQVDNGGPVSDKTAYRVSYLGRSGETYYQNTRDDTQDVFIALSHRFNDNVNLEWWAQAYDQTYSEVSGINRITQKLIDSGTYISGVATPSGFATASTIAAPTLVHIKAYQSVVGPDDIAHAKRFQTQGILTSQITPDTFVKNSTYFETRESDKYEPGINYYEYVPTDWNIQNRTEYNTKFDILGLNNNSISGLDLKVERLISYQSYFNEQYSTQDLSKASNTWSNVVNLPGSVPGNAKYGTDLGYGGNFGGNQDSLISDVGVFHQQDLKITSKLSAIAGGRMDFIHAQAKSPEYNAFGSYNRAGSSYSQNTAVEDPSYFLSSIYKITPTSSLYATYNAARAMKGSNNFGGIDVNNGGKQELIKALSAKSTLAEAGYKFVLFDNKLYNTVSVFRQSRVDISQTGSVGERLAKGGELESVYQANKNFNLLGNFTFQKVYRIDPSGKTYQYNVTPYTLQSNGSYVAGGGGDTIVPIKRRYAGTPEWMGNLRANYKFDNGFGIGIGPQFTGSQFANSEGTLKIPLQYKINMVLSYTIKTWDFQVNLDNLTNQKNWTVGDPDFTGNSVIYAEKPLTASFTTRYRF